MQTSGGPASHLIASEDVPRWLADSRNRVITYHRTSSAAANAIMRHGVEVTLSRVGAYGQGFYTATRTDPFYGESEISVAIRMLRPLEGDPDSVGVYIDGLLEDVFGPGAMLASSAAVLVRAGLLRLGFDGIIVRDGGGDGIDYVIAIDNATVKVVLP